VKSEDRLRDLLQAEVEDLVPAGDGLSVIRERLDSRRRRRSRLVPVMSVAGVVAVAAAAAVTFSVTRDDALDVQPGPPGPSALVTPDASAQPTPSPGTTTGVTTSGPGTPVWPFTSDAQAADWNADPGGRLWASDPVQVTQHLLDDFLQLPGAATTRISDSDGAAVVEVSAAGRPVSQVHLVKVGGAGRGPWSVTRAESDNLTMTSPADGDEATSPLTVTGTVPGVDQSVRLRLMTDSVLAEGFAPAGGAQPWSHVLRWPTSAWSVGALVASTFDGKGDLSAVALTAVRRGAGRPAAPRPAGSTLVAVQDSHVISVDASSGAVLRQVSFPTPAVDSAPDRGGEDEVAWVRTKTDGCTSAIIRANSQGKASTPVSFADRARRLPSLSADGGSLGWVDTACDGSQGLVIVRGPSGTVTTTATIAAAVSDLDVRADGTALVQVAGTVLVVAPGAAAVDEGRRLVPDSGCTLSAPAWDDQTPVAWEHCADGWVLARWTAAGTVDQRSRPVPGMSAVTHTAVDAGQVLVVLADGGVARLTDETLNPVPQPKRLAQADW
jgi:hypothetical protein